MIPTPKRSGKEPVEGAVFPSTVAAQNIQALRKRRRLSQKDITDRMNLLDHGWHTPTVSQVEGAMRAVTVEELWGLALALETTITSILTPKSLSGEGTSHLDAGLAEPLGMGAAARVLGENGDEYEMSHLVNWDCPRPELHGDREARPERIESAVEEFRDILSADEIDPRMAVRLFRAVVDTLRYRGPGRI
jgi:transcriptional regulator with XRE-family HTH domain